jgi:hypothetical protein
MNDSSRIDQDFPNDLEEVIIDQDHKKGPGWFLIISYVVIVIFCFYYLFAEWNWKSDYEVEQNRLKAEIESQQ